jgi:hypothetical protein
MKSFFRRKEKTLEEAALERDKAQQKLIKKELAERKAREKAEEKSKKAEEEAKQKEAKKAEKEAKKQADREAKEAQEAQKKLVEQAKKEAKERDKQAEKEAKEAARDPQKEINDKLCEVLPALLDLPEAYLGSGSTATLVFSAIASMAGDVLDTNRLRKLMQKELQKELGTEKSLADIFEDPVLKNRALQSKVFSGIIGDPRVWSITQTHEKKLLSVLEPKCYKKLDEELLDVIETPSTIDPASKELLVVETLKNPAAVRAVVGMASESVKSGNLERFLLASTTVKTEVGKAAKELGVEEKALQELKKIGIEAGVRVVKEVVKAPDLAEVMGEGGTALLGKGSPEDKLRVVAALLDSDAAAKLTKALVAELPSSRVLSADEPAIASDIAKALGADLPGLKPVTTDEAEAGLPGSKTKAPLVLTNADTIAKSVVGLLGPKASSMGVTPKLIEAFMPVAIEGATAVLSEDPKKIGQIVEKVATIVDPNVPDEKKAELLPVVVDEALKVVKSDGLVEAHARLVPVLKTHRKEVAGVIANFAKAQGVRVDGGRIVDLFSDPECLEGLEGLVRRIGDKGTKIGKVRLLASGIRFAFSKKMRGFLVRTALRNVDKIAKFLVVKAVLGAARVAQKIIKKESPVAQEKEAPVEAPSPAQEKEAPVKTHAQKFLEKRKIERGAGAAAGAAVAGRGP